MEMNDNTKLMLGILAGAAAGFAVGMMLAPQKGSDFRQGISDSLDNLGNRVSDLLNEGREKLSELARLKKNVEEKDVMGTAKAAHNVSKNVL
jgi:gas vesicle protein